MGKRNYKDLLNVGTTISDISVIEKDIESAGTWDDAYWIGQYLYGQSSGNTDKMIITAYEKSFELGLNIKENRDCFLSATQQIAKTYFQFRKYDEAINMLMVLDAHKETLPDWLNLYYASAQIHTDSIFNLVEQPSTLFKRIDHIDVNNPESVKRRKFIFLEFLNRATEISTAKSAEEFDKDAILTKAVELGIEKSVEFDNFKASMGMISKWPEPLELPEEAEVESEKPCKDISVYEKVIEDIKNKEEKLQKTIGKQKTFIDEKQAEIDEGNKIIAKLQKEAKGQKELFNRQEEKLKFAKESEHALQERCEMLLNKGAEPKPEAKASVTTGLKADIEGLESELKRNLNENRYLSYELKKSNATADSLRTELAQKQNEIKELRESIEVQKDQLEKIEAKLKASQEKNEDVSRESEKLASQPEDTRTRTSIDTPDAEEFLPRNKKILIIGGSRIKEKDLRGKIKSMDLGFSKGQLEFKLNYEDIKSYSSRIIASGKYAGIIVGPCPHKAKDTDGYSSLIEKLKAGEGYPHVVEAKDERGSLKISKSSISKAIHEMSVHLQSVV